MNVSDEKLLQAQLGTILAHARTAFISVSVATTIASIWLWLAYPHGVIMLWFLFMQATLIIRYLLCKKYRHKTLDANSARALKFQLTVVVFLNGLALGALAWLFPDNWSEYSLIILLPTLVVTAAAMNLSAVMPVYFSIVIPVIVQMILALSFSDSAHFIVSIFLLVYYVGVIGIALETNRMLARTYQLQFELESVNSELTIQKQNAEHANASKSRFLAAASHDLRQPLSAMGFFWPACLLKRAERSGTTCYPGFVVHWMACVKCLVHCWTCRALMPASSTPIKRTFLSNCYSTC